MIRGGGGAVLNEWKLRVRMFGRPHHYHNIEISLTSLVGLEIIFCYLLYW